jgi:Nuclease-related domain
MAAAHPRRHTGDPGASARAKAEAIRLQRERHATRRGTTARIIRGLLGPTAPEKRSIAEQRNWSTGAAGERMLARELLRRCPDVPVLHDVAIPGTRANIDHIAFAASGIYVIDAKRYKGRISVQRPWFGDPRLMIAGRDRTKLIAGIERQVAVVRSAIEATDDSDVPVHGCLCFLAPEGFLADVGLPTLRTLRINGHPLYYGRRLCKQLNRPGPLSDARVRALQGSVASRLPAARR